MSNDAPPGLPELAARGIARTIEEFVCALFARGATQVVGVSRTIADAPG
jgi:hypothetical protein